MSDTILVVEDNLQNRIMLRQVLIHHGYEVLEAVNGDEGTKMAKKHRPALILMDLQMPVMDGYTALRNLKNDPDAKDIKIVALTAFAMSGDREKAFEAGADDYMTKPIDIKQLPELIKKLLNGG